MNIELSPALRAFVDAQVKEGQFLDAGEVVRDAVRRMELDTRRPAAIGPSSADADVMASAIVMMMLAARPAEEDLRAIMERVKTLNREKERWREVASALNGLAASKEIDSAKETVKKKVDSLSEMGEMESLRLQMAMDRLSKLMSTLSNLLKKMSETASAITQNIK